MYSELTITPVHGDPFVVPATASLYAVRQNGETATLQESVRFRFNATGDTVRLGYSVRYDDSEWIIRDARIYQGARRIVVDATRISLDESRCQIVDIYQWDSEADCNARISPKKIYESERVSITDGSIGTVEIHDSRRKVKSFRVYMEQELARKLGGYTLIRDNQDFKVASISNLETPGTLAIVEAQVMQSKY